MTEAKEVFAKMLRWTPEAKDAKQAEGTIFIGTAVHGYYVGKREGVGQNDSTVYEILTMDKQKVSFWGSDLLDGKFAEIPLNSEVRVTCLGTQQPKTPAGRPYLGFKVEYDKDSKRPADFVEAAPANGVAAAPSTGAAPVAPTAAVAPADQGF